MGGLLAVTSILLGVTFSSTSAATGGVASFSSFFTGSTGGGLLSCVEELTGLVSACRSLEGALGFVAFGSAVVGAVVGVASVAAVSASDDSVDFGLSCAAGVVAAADLGMLEGVVFVWL